jgi:chromosomal replication initiation ATPase DnaA
MNWLKVRVLLQVIDRAARILVPSALAVAWLEWRLCEQISNALKGILGKDLECLTKPFDEF